MSVQNFLPTLSPKAGEKDGAPQVRSGSGRLGHPPFPGWLSPYRAVLDQWRSDPFLAKKNVNEKAIPDILVEHGGL
jgi:hypothetical protein